MAFERIRYEVPEPGIARVVLARPEKKNAQDQTMLYEINDALDMASADDEIKVIVVAAEGTDFSSGHEVGTSFIPERPPVLPQGGFRTKGAEQVMAVEQEIFLGLCWRWRNLPKPTIVSVHGRVIAAGLMLVWPFDLVVASEDARFSDPTVAFGLNGVEYFAHVWELGARRAKEILFTGRALTADEAYRCGMVNEVVPREQLEEATLTLARTIAERPMIGLKLAKQSVNQTQDAQGLWTSLQSAYSLHMASHVHGMLVHGKPIDGAGKRKIRELSGAEKP